MTSLQARKDSSHRGVAPTPSKIPVRPHRCPALPAGKPSAGDQENQDPRRMVQKLSSQPFLHGSADPTPKAAHQTEKSESLVGSTQHRNPLEELRPSPGGQSMGPGPPPQTEAPGAIEFVADPAALATILSGEGVKSCHLGRQPSLAQRVLIRGSQGGTLRRGQGARASAYLAPRTPIHRLDPARASCFSRLQGPGPRSQTLRPQRSEELSQILSSGPSSHPSTHPSFQELRRETGVSSRTSVSQAAELLLGTPVKPASSFPGREHEIVTHSDEGGGPLGLAQRVPLRENKDMTYTRDSRDCHPMPSPGQAGPPSTTRPSLFGQAQRVPSPSPSTRISYSVLRRLASHSKAQLTPIPQAPKVQQAQLRGLSPQSGPEEPVLPWDQITVRLFDQESCTRLQEGPGKPPVATLCSPHSSRTSNLQVLKMQRISILQQLLQQEVEGLAARPDSSSSLDMVELQPLLMEVSRTLSASEHKSGPFHVPEPLQHAGLPKPCLLEECGEPQPAPGADPQVAQPCPAPQLAPPESCHRRAPEVPEPPAQEQPKEPEPRPPVEPLQACPPGQTGLPKPSSELEPGASEACPPNPARSPQGPPATTSLTSQSPFCASPPSCSLQSPRPPTRQAGSSSLAPRTLALRQRLKACLTTIHCFHETCLDDECAFYTSRAPPSGPSRVCANPVATLLEWQEALCFIPVSSAGPRDSPA